jgi:Na+/melibiose symporter-like transporter
MRAMNKRLGKKFTMILGLIFVLLSTTLFWCIFHIEPYVRIEVTLIFACVFLGIGTSTTNICSFSLTSDLIGLNTECGAFVYGIMSFADKLANGVAIAIIQQFNPCLTTTDSTKKEACGLYYRQILTFIPTGVAILTIIILISIWKVNIGGNRHEAIVPERTPLVACKSPVNDDDYNERIPLVV